MHLQFCDLFPRQRISRHVKKSSGIANNDDDRHEHTQCGKSEMTQLDGSIRQTRVAGASWIETDLRLQNQQSIFENLDASITASVF